MKRYYEEQRQQRDSDRVSADAIERRSNAGEAFIPPSSMGTMSMRLPITPFHQPGSSDGTVAAVVSELCELVVASVGAVASQDGTVTSGYNVIPSSNTNSCNCSSADYLSTAAGSLESGPVDSNRPTTSQLHVVNTSLHNTQSPCESTILSQEQQQQRPASVRVASQVPASSNTTAAVANDDNDTDVNWVGNTGETTSLSQPPVARSGVAESPPSGDETSSSPPVNRAALEEMSLRRMMSEPVYQRFSAMRRALNLDNRNMLLTLLNRAEQYWNRYRTTRLPQDKYKAED